MNSTARLNIELLNELTRLPPKEIITSVSTIRGILRNYKNIIPNNLRVRALKAIGNSQPKLSNNTPFERFANKLVNIIRPNKNLHIKLNKRSIKLSYNRGNTYVIFEPMANNRSVYLALGATSNTSRGKGLGTRLRNYGARASRASGVPMYHMGINVEGLLPAGAMPISTRIVRKKLGAVRPHSFPGKNWTRRNFNKTAWPSLVRAHRYPTRGYGSRNN
jgi:hypothetical protein